VSTLAAIRPDDWNFPLFLHVLGAMLLMGSLFVVASSIVVGWRSADPADSVGLTRLGLRTLLMGVLPSFILMRIAAEWIAAEEDVQDPAPGWIDIGYITSDLGGVLMIVSIVLAIIGLTRLRRGSGIGLGRAVGVLSVLILALYVVAIWAMTTKPD
jgi:hypothetical protein